MILHSRNKPVLTGKFSLISYTWGGEEPELANRLYIHGQMIDSLLLNKDLQAVQSVLAKESQLKHSSYWLDELYELAFQFVQYLQGK